MFISYALFSIVLLACYLAVIVCYIVYWNQVDNWEIPTDYQPQTSVTVLVAARNEAQQIKHCIEALIAQQFPLHLLEIYIIDDHSTDNTANIIQTYIQQHPQLHLLALTGTQTGKKAALAAGIQASTHHLIVTTDADCTMHNHWLAYITSIYEAQKPKFIAAPVCFYQEENVLEQFQSLDFMGMMAVSAAGIKGQFMGLCNGANLAYERQVFEEVNGFEGIDHLACGDDMLLLQKIQAKYPAQITYLKNRKASTFTKAKNTWHDFLQQRLRWASKSSAYQGWQIWFMTGTVWLLCMSMLLDILLSLWNPLFLLALVSKFIVKAMSDFFFLQMMATFFDRPKLMKAFLPAAFLHWFYIVYVGTVGLFKQKIEWKSRYFYNK
jgi:cellulose synthase/poly-beta-1,6-N-acetylglucosamine synthase-like glycosyltransferase